MSVPSDLLERVDMCCKKDVTEIFEYYTERTEGSFIEFESSSITWHYRMADEEYELFQAKECQNHLENAVVSKMSIEILVGKKNLKVRLMMINREEAVKRILAQSPEAELIVCAGDDKTDEDMFRTLTARYLQKDVWQLYSITVGSRNKNSMANWQVEQPKDAIQLLGAMAKADTDEV